MVGQMSEEKFIGYLRLVEACAAPGCPVCWCVIRESRSRLGALLYEQVTDPDWFVTWMPNIHASLFMAIYRNVKRAAALERVDALIRAFRLYLEQCAANGLAPALTLTRAWRLVKFVEAGMLRYATCRRCDGEFIVRELDLTANYVCGCCQPPARAGKTRDAQARLAA